MTALLRAIEEEKKESPDQVVTFHVDSLTAIHMAEGMTLPRRTTGVNNRELARNLRRAYRELRESRPAGFVRIVHVRAHIGVHGNEAADHLARRGAEGAEYEQHTTDTRDTVPTEADGDG